MSNALFPNLKGLTWDVKKTPTFATGVHTSAGGYEVRLQYMQAPRWRWTLTYEMLSESGDFATLASFYVARGGQAQSFLYNDPTDYLVNGHTIGTGDGSTTAFQLTRAFGGINGGVEEPIYDVQTSTVSITLNGATQASNLYTLSSTGLVTFTTAPAAGVTVAWSGQYYWRVRFAMDEVEFNNFLYARWEAKTVTLLQVKGPVGTNG